MRRPSERVLAIFDALRSWEAAVGPLSRGCAFLDAQIELPDPEHPAAAVIDEHWRHLTARLVALAEDAGLPAGDRAARDLVLLYRGSLASLMLAPPAEVDRPRAGRGSRPPDRPRRARALRATRSHFQYPPTRGGAAVHRGPLTGSIRAAAC